jgi:hypothetical protein
MEQFTENSFLDWLRSSMEGESICYATGHMVVASVPEGSPQKKLYNLILRKNDDGLVALVQRRVGGTTQYVAQRTSKPLGRESFAQRITKAAAS